MANVFWLNGKTMARPTNLRTMYDAVTATNIPRKAQMVAGYVDTISIPQWSVADWALFPDAVHVEIVKKATSIFGNVLDVEKGDATAAQIPGWLTAMRARGFVPSVYTSYSNWNAVQQAVNNAGIAHPPYWIADYSQNSMTWWPTLNGIDAIAWQYTDPGAYDISLVTPYWEGINGMVMELTDLVPVPNLDSNGNYTGDGADAPVSDLLRFSDASVRWLVEKWVPYVNGVLASIVTQVSALQNAQTPEQLTGTATVNVSLAPVPPAN